MNEISTVLILKFKKRSCDLSAEKPIKTLRGLSRAFSLYTPTSTREVLFTFFYILQGFRFSPTISP